MQLALMQGQAEGVRRKRDGQAQVESTIHNYTFIRAMRSMAVNIAHAKCGFQGDDLIGFVNADDLREYADARGIEPDHPNAWGAVFRSAPTGYRFEKTGEWRQSRIPSNHGREIPTWAVYREDVAA